MRDAKDRFVETEVGVLTRPRRIVDTETGSEITVAYLNRHFAQTGVVSRRDPKPLSGGSELASSLRYRLENGRLGGYFVLVDDHGVDSRRAQLSDCKIKDGNVILKAKRYFVERQPGYYAHGTFPVPKHIIWQSKLEETIVYSFHGFGWLLECGTDFVIIY